jgi:murein DD-endopeptidase MepM/ murein hydrolase activator NlpD
MTFMLVRTLSYAVIVYVAVAIAEPIVDRTLYAAYLVGLPMSNVLMVPVQGTRPAALRNSWHASRDGGRRRHEGIDLFAPKGTPVRATTEGIIRRIGSSKLGGKVVWVLGPAGQQHYYAHLDSFAYIRTGQRIQQGTMLGYVGNTGNARSTPPHLHYGIYGASGAINPFPFSSMNSIAHEVN